MYGFHTLCVAIFLKYAVLLCASFQCLVVEQEARPRHEHAAAEGRVEGRGQADGVALPVDDGQVRRLAALGRRRPPRRNIERDERSGGRAVDGGAQGVMQPSCLSRGRARDHGRVTRATR